MIWSKLSPKLKILLGSMILANISNRLYRPFLPLYILSVGGSVADVGIFYTVDTVASAILRPLGGWLSDSLGRLQTVGIGTVFGLIGALGYAIAPTWQWMLVATVGMALGRATVGPSFHAYTAENAPQAQLAQTFGLVNGLFHIVDVIGPTLGGWIASRSGLHSLFWWSFGFMLAASILRVVVARRQPFHWQNVRMSSLKLGFAGMLGGMLAGGVLTWLLVTDTLRDFGINLYENLRSVLMQNWGYNEQLIGLLFSLHAVVYLLVNLFGSRLADRWSPGGTLAVGGILEVTGLTLLASLPGAGMIPAYLIISAIGIGLGDPAFDTMLVRAAPKGYLGMTFGMFRMTTSFLAMPAPYIGSLLWENAGSLAPFASGAVALLAASLLTWFVLRPMVERTHPAIPAQE